MKTKFGLKAMTALLFNAVMGIMLAAFMGVSATAGAATRRRRIIGGRKVHAFRLTL